MRLTSRIEFTKGVKAACLRRANYLCEVEGCGKPAKEIDHVVPAGLGGKATLDNAMALCLDHHRLKTSGIDVPRIAKTKRQKQKHEGTWRAPKSIIPGSRRSRWKRLMSGRTVRREK